MNSYKLDSDITLVFNSSLRVGQKYIQPASATGYVVDESGKEIGEMVADINGKEVISIIPSTMFSKIGTYRAIFKINYNGYGERPHSVDFKVTPSPEGKRRIRRN